MTEKISAIEIRGFRGIPDILTLDFRPERNNTPVSFILSGDNGTGKSSIIDAIEFVLQGKIARKRKFLHEVVPSAINLIETRKCEVTATLTDETIITRTISRNEKGRWVTNRRPHPLFAISPFVLRRADILEFWSAPDIQRQTVFFDYVDSSIKCNFEGSQKR
jgi:DNA repair ATPase RecN